MRVRIERDESDEQPESTLAGKATRADASDGWGIEQGSGTRESWFSKHRESLVDAGSQAVDWAADAGVTAGLMFNVAVTPVDRPVTLEAVNQQPISRPLEQPSAGELVVDLARDVDTNLDAALPEDVQQLADWEDVRKRGARPVDRRRDGADDD